MPASIAVRSCTTTAPTRRLTSPSVIVGHIVVGLVLAVEMAYRPPLWVHAALWLPLTLILALTVLPIVKGALVALQWALLMHGFDPDAEEVIGDGLPDVDPSPLPRRLDFRP